MKEAFAITAAFLQTASVGSALYGQIPLALAFAYAAFLSLALSYTWNNLIKAS